MTRTEKTKTFTRLLMQWHKKENNRTMPWKGEADPYKIWLSEIIMQQTRVEQGLGYYNRFITRFPDIFSLAAAPDEEVFKYWEGLGYYNRCRNLLTTARYLVMHQNGSFPASYDALLALKGIGPYTAAAVASFGFGLPFAVVDGNVMRVLSRFFNSDTPIDVPAGKKKLEALAQEVLDKRKPAAFNQAIMDFGATVCKPGQPLCNRCLLADACEGFAAGNEKNFPVKAKKMERRSRFFAYLLLECNGYIWVSGQQETDIWRHLNQLYRVELADADALASFDPGKDPEIAAWPVTDIAHFPDTHRQLLTHQEVCMRFWHLSFSTMPAISIGHWVDKIALQKLAFPKTINTFLGSTGLR